jgi:hypothetical protein
MNTAIFVGKFPEIAHLSKEEQLQLLEKARYEAFVKLGLAGKAALLVAACPVVGFVIAMIPVVILGASGAIWLAVSLFLGIAFANLACQRLYHGLLNRGLKSVLAQPKTNVDAHS